MYRIALLLAIIALLPSVAAAQGGSAVREGSSAGIFCSVASGSEAVFVSGKPMAREGDLITCVEGALCDDDLTPISGVIANGSSSVFINGVPAAVSNISTIEDSCFPLSLGAGWVFVSIGS